MIQYVKETLKFLKSNKKYFKNSWVLKTLRQDLIAYCLFIIIGFFLALASVIHRNDIVNFLTLIVAGVAIIFAGVRGIKVTIKNIREYIDLIKRNEKEL